MNKFMVLYESDVSATEKMAGATPEQMKASMQDWMDWRDAKQKAGAVIDFGMPLAARKHVAADGTVSAADLSRVSGYAMIEAASLDAVVELLRDHPHLKVSPDSAIEVLEFLSMPGLEG